MYAVIRAGGKQHKVAEGDIIEVERVKQDGDALEFTPLLVVDDKGKVTSGKSDLAAAVVSANVLDQGKGAKLDIYKFRNKTGYRRHAGHRQAFTRIEISSISVSGSKPKTTAKKTTAKKTTAKKTSAKKPTAEKTTAKKTAKKTTAKKSTDEEATA